MGGKTSRHKEFYVIQNVITLIVLMLQILNYVVESASDADDFFDFIVVGGGTAGNAIAARLTKTGVYKVLLVEAGGLPEPEWSVPALGFEMFQSNTTRALRVYPSVPQNNAGLSNNGTIAYLVGRTLGGSSTVNAMYFNRGSPMDYSKWARETLNNNWGYEKLLPYFKKSENYSAQFLAGDLENQHGYDGPITVSSSNYAPGFDVWAQASMELGYPVASPNGPQKISFSTVEWSQNNGRRVSSYDGYIKPLLRSNEGKNLQILLNTEATKIIFNGKRAVGIEYKTNLFGQEKFGIARATKEIIISAGVISSPTLLLKSGIGPRPFLDAARIPVVQYLTGVGKNFQDHAVIALPIIVNNRSVVFDADRDLTLENWKLYTSTGTGPYASFGGAVGQAFLSSPKSSTNWKANFIDGWPDTQLIFQYHSPPVHFGEGYLQQLQQELREDESIVTVLTLVGRPQSRGTITLDQQNLDNPPLIDFRFFTHRSDLQVAVEGMKTTVKITQTSAFRRLGARLPRTPVSACKHLEMYSDEYWRCYVRQVTGSGFHGCGTNKMGAGPGDHQAVVDTQLKVIGVRGLRICDASVFPSVTNSNIQAAVYAVAEKAVDMILNTWITSVPPTRDQLDFVDDEGDEEFKTKYILKLSE